MQVVIRAGNITDTS